MHRRILSARLRGELLELRIGSRRTGDEIGSIVEKTDVGVPRLGGMFEASGTIMMSDQAPYARRRLKSNGDRRRGDI